MTFGPRREYKRRPQYHQNRKETLHISTTQDGDSKQQIFKIAFKTSTTVAGS
ncbi:hypothetical protein I79_015149 [Cricetulus griseus]|uniref:Uncharacterized protein n=1 Tax=Cricetulus griseus TaxID=10029 RepID=G3HW02_CRIGR|nr:hypothetical protein I79_015149 [Cricetulus griseus]